jgi:uncharacterized protein (UPF0261 family)
MPASIAVIGTMDTKGDQIKYLKKQIESHGHKTTVIDVGVLGPVPFKPTIRREQVAEAVGLSLKEVVALNDNFLVLSKMAEGASKIVYELCSKRELEGVIAVGGSQATSLALTVMRAVPLGVPKIVVTTVAYSQLITPDMVSGEDVIMIPWTAGLWGLNSMSKRVMETAAGAISGAADAYKKRKVTKKKIVGVTSLGGSVNRYMNQLKPALEKRGYEVAVFHVTGMSGRMFERAISDDFISVSLDLSAGIELLNTVTDGACAAGEHRLEAAGKMGIPQIISPGAIEAFHWGKDRPFPAKYEDRPRHQHSAFILTVGSSMEEIAATGKLMAGKLNEARGPVAVVLPMRGMIGLGDSPKPPAGTPPPEGYMKFIKALRSITLPGMEAFKEALMENIKPDIKVVILDVGFNDPPYVETVLKLFDEMMSMQTLHRRKGIKQ